MSQTLKSDSEMDTDDNKKAAGKRSSEMATDDNERAASKPKREKNDLDLMKERPKYYLFEGACGYFLVLVKERLEIFDAKWPEMENLINRYQIFNLVGFHIFASPEEAMEHYTCVFNGILPERLTTFLDNNLPKERYAGGLPAFALVLIRGMLGPIITTRMGLPSGQAGQFHDYIIRGIRIHIRSLVKDLKAEDMEKAIRGLARCYIAQSPFSRMAQCGQITNKPVISNAPSSLKFVACSAHTPSTPAVVPHKLLEGVFVGPDNVLYTKNQNFDGLEADYTEWNPIKSKLACAILNGARNIGIKSGSHVLCLGSECETTIANISNLVGPGGLVYVVGRKNVEYLARSNIISINANPDDAYHMLVDMVDVMLLTVDDDYKYSPGIAAHNASYFLKPNGFYLTYDKDMKRGPKFAFATMSRRQQREFHPLQQISLKPHDMHHNFIIGNFRKSCFI